MTDTPITASLKAIIAEAQSALDRIAAPLVEPAKSVPVDPLSPPAVFVIPDVEVLPGERVAYVRVQLKEPVPRQLRVTFSTANGALGLSGTAKQPWATYQKTVRDLVFLPYETEKVVPVPLYRDVDLNSFKAGVDHSLNNPPVAPVYATVCGVTERAPVVFREQPSYAPIDGRKGRTLVYSTDFRDLSGWDKRGGFYQSGNKEAALYCDAAMHPGFDPHPMVDGKRVLRMIRQDIKVDMDGREQTFRYRAPMLRSRPDTYVWKHGDHIELDCIVAPNTGGVPAFWGAAEKPYAEIDGFEFGLGGKPNMACHAHWGLPIGTAMEGVAVAHIPDGLPHTYAVTRTDDWLVTSVDGVEVHRRPAIFPDRDMPVILNNTTGGILRDDPKWKVGQTEDFVLLAFRAYRKAG